eukprot:CAMPEP_0197027614 /NCGR_PEP_ID=MMETSP1384-20130603/7490_1 /TAXON_ID=29189 /ORGANISM="Ammonia sp." /LENGTH=336 /DNA_ID=CAMNT_0042456481 /DNA_START=15 /DNA_END=1025 /DNA_ORIENTATION=+
MTTNIEPDPEPFGPFSVAEVENCFKAFDLDNNGFVGAGELRKVYQHLGETATDEDIDEMIKMCDQDGDGQITFDEFARMIFRHSGPPKVIQKPKPSLLSPKEQDDIISKSASKKKLRPIVSAITGYGSKHNLSELAEEEHKQRPFRMMTVAERADRAFVLKNMIREIRFDSKDIDEIHANFLRLCPNGGKDGMTSYDTFCAAVQEKPINPICESLFKLFQPGMVDGEQKINFREFLISVVHVLATNNPLKIRYAFNIFDADHNGSIDRSELLQILKSTHMEYNIEKVESKATAIMRQVDVNNDGVLTFDEFQSVVNKFPNLIFPTLDKAAKRSLLD